MPVSIGLDGVHCTIILKKQARNVRSIDKNLRNTDGTIYGNVKSKGTEIKLTFNLPLLLRDDNLIPFGQDDKKYIPYIKRKIEDDLKVLYGNDIKCIIPNAIEVNVTKQLKNVNTYEVLKLLSLSYAQEKEQLLIWAQKGKYEIKTTGILTQTIVNEYRLKAYDKSEQLNSKLKMPQNKIKYDNNILRFELIFQGRRIKQTYGGINCNVFDVLDDIDPLIEVFKAKFQGEVIKRIRYFLTESKNVMFEELTEGYRPKDVFSRYQGIIVDAKQIQKALQRYYLFCGKKDNSKPLCKIISKALNIETGVLKEFVNLLKED